MVHENEFFVHNFYYTCGTSPGIKRTFTPLPLQKIGALFVTNQGYFSFSSLRPQSRKPDFAVIICHV